jgi:hypothetical protein
MMLAGGCCVTSAADATPATGGAFGKGEVSCEGKHHARSNWKDDLLVLGHVVPPKLNQFA